MTAFTSNLQNQESLLKLGAHEVVNSRDPESIKALKGGLLVVPASMIFDHGSD